jgi:hypothetical protein
MFDRPHERNKEFLNVKADGIYSYHLASKGKKENCLHYSELIPLHLHGQNEDNKFWGELTIHNLI